MIATWWTQATPGTTHWRCIIPARKLGQALHLDYSDLVLDENGEPFMPRQKGHAAVWQFPGNMTRATLMAHQQEMGIRVLVEVDDNYLHPPPHIPFTKSVWLKKHPRQGADEHSFEAHARIAKWADGIIVSTEPLADAYERVNENVFICPNSADLDDWEPTYYSEKEEGPLSIGYAGSDSHQYDAALVHRALGDAAHAGAKVWKMGLQRVQWHFPHEVMPWTNSLPEYRKNLQRLDVGLCPLKRSPWHDCKSDVKAIEYTLAGALPIVQSDTPVYRDWLEVVPSASSEKEWAKVVKQVAQMGLHGRRKLWEDAYHFVLDMKLIDQHIHTWKEAFS